MTAKHVAFEVFQTIITRSSSEVPLAGGVWAPAPKLRTTGSASTVLGVFRSSSATSLDLPRSLNRSNRPVQPNDLFVSKFAKILANLA